MNLVDIQPRDIHFLVDHSMSDLLSLKIILENMEFNKAPGNPDHEKADKYLHEVLYPAVLDILETNPDGT